MQGIHQQQFLCSQERWLYLSLTAAAAAAVALAAEAAAAAAAVPREKQKVYPSPVILISDNTKDEIASTLCLTKQFIA